MVIDNKQVVLIVDDEEDALDVLKEQLTSDNFIVIKANCVASARALLQVLNVNVIVTDLVMPDVSGMSFLRDFTNRPDRPLIAVLTGAMQVTGLDPNSYDLLFEKPQDIFKIASSLKDHLNKVA